MGAKLVVLSGKQKDREIPLPGTMFLIGRDKKCHLRPKSLLVSRCHCAIACWAGKVSVRDLKSANGTFVNNQQVLGEVKVLDGDQLRVGNLVLGFRIPAASGDPPTPTSFRTLDWLLNTPSANLDPDRSTVIVHLNGGPAPPEGEAEPAESGTFFAGQLLKEYVRGRRRPTPST